MDRVIVSAGESRGREVEGSRGNVAFHSYDSVEKWKSERVKHEMDMGCWGVERSRGRGVEECWGKERRGD